MSDMEPEFFHDGKAHKLTLGPTFRRHPNTAFHTVRYDFKPASVDHNQEGELEVQDGHEVSITLPNVADSKTPCTVYKGSKKPALKECVLIYNHETGEFSLDRISSQIQVKKTRLAGNANFSSRPTLPAPPVPKLPKVLMSKKQRKTPTATNKPFNKKQDAPSPQSQKKNEQIPPSSSANVPKMNKSNPEIAPVDPKLNTTPGKINRSAFSTDESPSSSSNSSNSSSSDDDSSSSSDENTNTAPPPPKPVAAFDSQLHEDLELSESGSESD